VVSDLVDAHAGSFVLISYHIDDSYAIPWGENRLENFYFLGTTTPTLMLDGWKECPVRSYGDCVAQELGGTTDVLMTLSGSEVSGATWDVYSEVCLEDGASSKSMRIYTAATLNDYPNPPEHSRNLAMQEVSHEDLTLNGGECRQITTRFTFDAQSWAHKEEIVIISWAQEPGTTGPATTFQAAEMGWPFPANAELTSIEISPASVDLDVGDTQVFSATGKDQDGHDFPLSNPAWSANGDGSGEFSPASGSSTTSFWAIQPGVVQVVCEEDGVTGHAEIRINGDPPVLDSISITPDTLDLEVGQRRSLSAVGMDQYGREYVLRNPVWTIEGEGRGEFHLPSGQPSTVFTATRPGNAEIHCTDGDVLGIVGVVITGDPPQLTEVSITPGNVTIALGSTVEFIAEGIDQYGDAFVPDALVWSLSGDGDGSLEVLDGGRVRLSATSVGSLVLTAEQDGLEATASVEIVKNLLPPPRRIRTRH